MGSGEGGEFTVQLKKWMYDIMYGGQDHEWGIVIQEEQ